MIYFFGFRPPYHGSLCGSPYTNTSVGVFYQSFPLLLTFGYNLGIYTISLSLPPLSLYLYDKELEDSLQMCPGMLGNVYGNLASDIINYLVQLRS